MDYSLIAFAPAIGVNGRLLISADLLEIAIISNKISDHTPIGAPGIGENGITGTAAAVVVAIYNATGKRIRDLPIMFDKLM